MTSTPTVQFDFAAAYQGNSGEKIPNWFATADLNKAGDEVTIHTPVAVSVQAVPEGKRKPRSVQHVIPMTVKIPVLDDPLSKAMYLEEEWTTCKNCTTYFTDEEGRFYRDETPLQQLFEGDTTHPDWNCFRFSDEPQEYWTNILLNYPHSTVSGLSPVHSCSPHEVLVPNELMHQYSASKTEYGRPIVYEYVDLEAAWELIQSAVEDAWSGVAYRDGVLIVPCEEPTAQLGCGLYGMESLPPISFADPDVPTLLNRVSRNDYTVTVYKPDVFTAATLEETCQDLESQIASKQRELSHLTLNPAQAIDTNRPHWEVMDSFAWESRAETVMGELRTLSGIRQRLTV